MICINLLRSRSGRAWRAIHVRETVAEALGINIARYKLLAFVISSSMTSVAGCLFAYYRGFVSVEAFDLFVSIQYVAMIIIGGMGSLLGALLGAMFVTVFPYLIEALLRLLPNAQKLAGDIFAVNYAAFGVVMILFLIFEPLGLVGNMAAFAELLSALAFQIQAAGGSTQMTAALLQVDKIEVVYKRVITAVQGVTLSVGERQIVAILGTNGAGKTTTLRAISGFLGIDDARISEGVVTFKGTRIENELPHKIAGRGIVLVPEREKVFPNLTVAENLAAPVSRTARSGEFAPARGAHLSFLSAPYRIAKPDCRSSIRWRAANAGDRRGTDVWTATIAGRRAIARPGTGHCARSYPSSEVDTR